MFLFDSLVGCPKHSQGNVNYAKHALVFSDTAHTLQITQLTQNHPDDEPNPGATAQLHHEVDVDEHADDGQDRQKGHLPKEIDTHIHSQRQPLVLSIV